MINYCQTIMPDFIGLCSPISQKQYRMQLSRLEDSVNIRQIYAMYSYLALTKGDTWECAGIVVRNMLVTYDRFNQQIGFFKTNCTDLWSILPAEAPISPPPAAPPVNEQAPPVESPTAPLLATPSPTPVPEGMYPQIEAAAHPREFGMKCNRIHF